MENLHLSWAAVESACRSLAEDIRSQTIRKEFGSIVAVAKGGVTPAVMIYDLLGWNVPFYSVHISSYHSEDRTQSKIAFRTQLSNDARNGTALFIDDIVDSGETMKALPNGGFKAALVTKPRGAPFVNAYSILVPQDWWVVFPWETKDDDRN